MTEHEIDQELIRIAHESMRGDWERDCVPMEEAMKSLGITEEDLAAAEDLEFEIERIS